MTAIPPWPLHVKLIPNINSHFGLRAECRVIAGVIDFVCSLVINVLYTVANPNSAYTFSLHLSLEVFLVSRDSKNIQTDVK